MLRQLTAYLGLAALAGAASGQEAPIALRVERVHTGDGTVMVADDGERITVVVHHGKIVSLGEEAPGGAEELDYGPGSTLIPGLVAADTRIGGEVASARTADLTLNAIDGFDFYRDYPKTLSGGVTSVYLAPARGRLIAGRGALVKLFGDDNEARVLSAAATVHGAISAEARNTPNYWEPPVPATVDQGIDPPQRQLPRTTMGAIVALEELLTAAARDEVATEYGDAIAGLLAGELTAGHPWRVTARDESEILALLRLNRVAKLPLVVHGADRAGGVARELAAAGVGVIFESSFRPGGNGRDRGKSVDARWPDYGVPARLAEAGVPVAISSAGLTRDLRFAAALASRGGLPAETALRAISLTPAELYGVADRVGSVAVGKDADLVVLNGEPIALGSSVLATWVDGQLAWSPRPASDKNASAAESALGFAQPAQSLVIEVDELHVGDGDVLRPGAILTRGGKIAEIGARVARPAGAQVVRAFAAGPGFIDTLGYLGLEGSKTAVGPDYKLRRIVAPGDAADRRVAREGVTTVLLTPRGMSAAGSPVMAYKPAASEGDAQVVEDTCALRMSWEDKNAYKRGATIRGILEKAAKYHESWNEYESEIADWNAKNPVAETDRPRPTMPVRASEEEAEDEESDDDKAEKDSKAKSKKKKKKKKKDKPADPHPATGQWEGAVDGAPTAESSFIRVRLMEGEGDELEGNLRCDFASTSLVSLEGRLDREASTLHVRGLGSSGIVQLEGKLDEGKFDGTLNVSGTVYELELARKDREYPVVKRPDPRGPQPEEDEKDDDEDEGKAKKKSKSKGPKPPKEPKRDTKLDVLRRAFDGEVAIVVDVRRADQILACVEFFRSVGIRPILHGADDAHLVADDIRDGIAGVLPGPSVTQTSSRDGDRVRNRYAELQAAGIPVAFYSLAEEGAIDLPIMAAYAVATGMSPMGAMRALTSDAARMFSIDDSVGRLAVGLDADVVLFDGDPLEVQTSVVGVVVGGSQIQ